MARSMSLVKNRSNSSKDLQDCCVFCKSSVDDELILGKMYKLNDLCIHYYCMLFSSGLKQSGSSDTDGILGFLESDILVEVKRGSRLKCCYCKKSGATVGCVSRNCRKAFHLICGLKSNSLHQFFGTFCSYCPQHRPMQSIDENFNFDIISPCPICLNKIDSNALCNSLKSPCCNNSWFHRTCIQKQALNAGYFFKCPICNNQDAFQEEMLQYGIYVPQQDASWEREENAFQDLLYRHNHCDAKICICSRGRNYDKESTKWEVKLCSTCGSQGIHIGCARMQNYKVCWECPECREILKKKRWEKKYGNSSLHDNPLLNLDLDEDEVAKLKRKKKRKTKRKTKKLLKKSNQTRNAYYDTKVENLSYLPDSSAPQNSESCNYVQVTLSPNNVIRVSCDDWSSLMKNATQLRNRLQDEKNGIIRWQTLKSEYNKLDVQKNNYVAQDEADMDTNLASYSSINNKDKTVNSSCMNVVHDKEDVSKNIPLNDNCDKNDMLVENNDNSAGIYTNSASKIPFTQSFDEFKSINNSTHKQSYKVQKARKSMKSSYSSLDFTYARQVSPNC